MILGEEQYLAQRFEEKNNILHYLRFEKNYFCNNASRSVSFFGTMILGVEHYLAQQF